MAEGMKVVLSPIAGLTKPDALPSAFHFQCPPLDEFSVEYAYSHTDYDTITEGQFSRRGGPQLTSVSFDTLLVDYASFAVVRDPVFIEDHTEVLQRLLGSGSPFLLTCAHSIPANLVDFSATLVGPELQMYATLRSLRVAERAGEPDARYVNVSFTEYRDPIVQRNRAGSRPKRGVGQRFPVRVVMLGDGTARDYRGRIDAPVTLAKLAQRWYGDAAKHPYIRQINGLGSWGANTPLNGPTGMPQFRRGGEIMVPDPEGMNYTSGRTPANFRI